MTSEHRPKDRPALQSLWVPEDLRDIGHAATSAVYAARAVIREAVNDDVTEVAASALLNKCLRLLHCAQAVRDKGRPLIPELVEARRRLGEPLPAICALIDACAVGLSGSFAYHVLDAWCESGETDDGPAHRVHISRVTVEQLAAMRNRLRSVAEPDAGELARLIDREIRMAAELRLPEPSQSADEKMHATRAPGDSGAVATLNPPAERVRDLLTTNELAALALVKPKTLFNKLSASRKDAKTGSKPPAPAIKGSGQTRDRYSYAAILPWLRLTWPANVARFPNTYDAARQILANETP